MRCSRTLASAFARHRALGVPWNLLRISGISSPQLSLSGSKGAKALSNTSSLEEELACEGIEDCDDALEELLEEREDADEFLEEEREEQADDFLESRLGIDDLEEHDPDEHSFSFSSLEEVASEEWSSRVST